nr:hypothetical protein [Desulfobacterales bacterium]
MDEQFLTHNSENLSKVLKKAELFYQSIENRKLGLLTAEDELRALAAKHYFTNVKINRHEGGNASEGIVGVTLSFKGSLQGIVKWLRAICRDFPYIPVTGIRMRIEGPRAQAEFQVFLNYRYRITSTGSSA